MTLGHGVLTESRGCSLPREAADALGAEGWDQAGRWPRMLFGALFPPCRKRALRPRRPEEEVQRVHVGPDACVQTPAPGLAPLLHRHWHGLDPRAGRDG